MGSYIDEFQGDHEKDSDIVVTVDGTSGAGKGTLGKQMAEMLDIPHYSAGDFFRKIAEEKDMTVEELSEKADRDVDVEVDQKTLEKGLQQSCVIDGRLPSRVLGDYSDLKIFMTADLEKRAERIAERENLRFEDALQRTKQRDKDNNRRYENYYDIDTGNLEIYDVVMDNTDLDIDEQKSVAREILEESFPERMRAENQ